MQKPLEPTYIPCLKLSPSYIVGFTQPLERFVRRKDKLQLRYEKESRLELALMEYAATLENTNKGLNLDNSTGGVISSKAGKRLKVAINWLVASACEKKTKCRITGKTFKFKVNFITLTLPSAQGQYSDNEIKSKLLNHWLIFAKRKYGLKNYVWKAEKQENGNIHFHITSDTYIFHYDLRKDWNLICQKLGFISAYRKAQMSFHSGEFKLRKDLLKHWSAEKQLKAYNEGVRTRWSNPNSTDVKSVINIRDLSAYLCKYMSKSDKDLKEYNYRKKLAKKENQAFTEPPPIQVSGRLWGCSSNISKIAAQYLWGFSPSVQASNSVWDNSAIRCKSLDFASLAFVKPSDYFRSIHSEISKYYHRLVWKLQHSVEVGYNINQDNWEDEIAA